MKITMHEIETMKEKSHRSILCGFLDDIFAMRDKNISFPLIRDWLKEQGINTTVQNISQFYKRNQKAKTNTNKQVIPPTKIGGIFSDLK